MAALPTHSLVAMCDLLHPLRLPLSDAFSARLLARAPALAGHLDAQAFGEWLALLLTMLRADSGAPSIVSAAVTVLEWGATRHLSPAHHRAAAQALDWAIRDLLLDRYDAISIQHVAERTRLLEQIAERRMPVR